MSQKINDFLEKEERSKEWLRKKIDVSYRTVLRWCDGGTISTKYLLPLSKLIKCNIKDLLK